MTNPLLENFNGKDQAVPFDKIKTEHFLPAIEKSIELAKNKIETIRKTQDVNFKNVIEALEAATEKVDNIAGIYFNLLSSEANDELQALSQKISPMLSALSSDIALDPEIFQKIKFVYDHRKDLKLSSEQIQLTEKTYKDFARNGALLSPEKKERLRALDQELSILGPQFSENVLKSTNAFELWLTDESDLAGLPEGAREAAKAAAAQKNKPDQWLITLQAPSLIPFLTFSSRSDLREKLWRAFNSRALGGENDNREIIKKTLNLKYERAQILGYPNYAEYILEERMAKDSKTVMSFLNSLLAPSKKAAEKDLQEVKLFRKELEGTDEIKPWDFAYYSEKLKEKKYAFNEEELRPYFKLENVIEGAFEHARKLYQLTFKEVTDVPVYHPDVKVYEVYDSHSQEYIGLFYTDFFPRETKKPGAWMTNYREQGRWNGDLKRPHVSIVCNFTKPTPTKPSLLSYDEVRTLFHEFGHSLHGLLSKCEFRTIGGTNVYWDFVELPSQIMENWTEEKESLDLFAKHYQTGEKIPAELVAKIKKAAQFQAGWMSLRQLSYGLLDMTWYTTNPSQISSVEQFETEAMSKTSLFPKESGTNVSVSFAHIFAGGYSAGYYSYKWAEVLDADAFEYFKEQGLFNTEVAAKFKNSILSRGSSAHPMDLYKEFRGREPDPNSLLRRYGLIEK